MRKKKTTIGEALARAILPKPQYGPRPGRVPKVLPGRPQRPLVPHSHPAYGRNSMENPPTQLIQDLRPGTYAFNDNNGEFEVVREEPIPTGTAVFVNFIGGGQIAHPLDTQILITDQL